MDNYNNSWLASAYCCKECGDKIIITQCPTNTYYDYWWYCASKNCINHDGEMTGDMEEPDFVKGRIIN